MNKKIIKSILICSILIITCIILAGCGKKTEDKNMEVAKLVDQYAPFEFTMKYPKDAGYEFKADLDNTPYVSGKLINQGKNIEISIRFDVTADSNFKSEKESNSKHDNYAETKYTELGGYEYCTDKVYKCVSLLNTFEEFRHIEVIIEMERYKVADVNLLEISKSEEFKKMLQSISFNDKIDGIKVDGIISDNHKLIIKNLQSPDESKYEAKQYQSSQGIMNEYTLKDNNKKAEFKICYYGNTGNYKDMDTYITYKENSHKKKYQDYTLFGHNIKVDVSKYPIGENAYPNKYKVWLEGAFEKNGKIFEILYRQGIGIEDSLGEKLFNDVLENMTTQD